MRLRVQSLASLSGLRIWRCHELWHRSQTRHGSHVAAAVVVVCRLAATAPIQPLAWEPPHAMGAALKKLNKPNLKNRKAMMAGRYLELKINGREAHHCQN